MSLEPLQQGKQETHFRFSREIWVYAARMRFVRCVVGQFFKSVLFFLLFLPLLLVAPINSEAKTINILVEGLNGELKKNVNAHLSSIEIDRKEIGRAQQALVREAVLLAMRAKGYYEPRVTIKLLKDHHGGNFLLKVHINPGQPVRVAEIKVVIDGAARTDLDYRRLLENNLPTVGSVLDHGQFDHLVDLLSDLAVRKGYFAAKLRQSELAVAPANYQAFWRIHFDSGTRNCFGPVIIRGSKIRPYIIRNLAPFKAGDPYSVDGLMEFNHRLLDLHWFKTVVVTPPLSSTEYEDRCFPLLVNIEHYKSNLLGLGLSYATDEKVGFRARWRKPCFNSLGHHFESKISLSRKKRQLDFEYTIPLPKNALEHYFVIKNSWKYESLINSSSKGFDFSVGRHWDFLNGWQRAVTMHWLVDWDKKSNLAMRSDIIYPDFALRRVRRQVDSESTWGDSQTYSVGFSNRAWKSDVNFLLLKADHVWVRTLGPAHRLVARAGGGWIKTNDFDALPLSLRFFAGGDRSIRGYPYRGIPFGCDDAKLGGASALFTSSIEYQYNVFGSWWLALFVDSGDAANRLFSQPLKTGAGGGLRWVSPIGPIKLDLATSVGANRNKRIFLYLSFGPEL